MRDIPRTERGINGIRNLYNEAKLFWETLGSLPNWTQMVQHTITARNLSQCPNHFTARHPGGGGAPYVTFISVDAARRFNELFPDRVLQSIPTEAKRLEYPAPFLTIRYDRWKC
jgi:hypothetical protein